MASYSEMVARIQDELANDGDITTTQIKYAIQDTIKVYERRPWWFTSTTGTFTTIANTEYYTATNWPDISNAVNIYALTITYSGIKKPLQPVDYKMIDDEQTGTIISVPRLYAYFAQSLRLYPIPDGAYTMTISYTKRLTTLSADADTNAWTTEAEELIRQGAKRRIALNYLESPDVASRFTSLEGEAYSEMMAENRRRWPNTRLYPPAMLPKTGFDIITG